MKTLEMPKPIPKEPKPLVRELAEMKHLLRCLRERLGSQVELDEAIDRLDILLGDLTIASGGML